MILLPITTYLGLPPLPPSPVHTSGWLSFPALQMNDTTSLMISLSTPPHRYLIRPHSIPPLPLVVLVVLRKLSHGSGTPCSLLLSLSALAHDSLPSCPKLASPPPGASSYGGCATDPELAVKEQKQESNRIILMMTM